MGIIKCVCISAEKKTAGKNVHQCMVTSTGLSGDCHCGMGDKQISLLPYDAVKDYYEQKGEAVCYGGFGENLVVEGLDWGSLKPEDKLVSEDVLLEVTRIGSTGGKDYDGEKLCSPMEDLFVFCRVIHSGILTENEVIAID